MVFLVNARVEVKITQTRYSVSEAEQILRGSMHLFKTNDIELTLTLDGGAVCREDWDKSNKETQEKHKTLSKKDFDKWAEERAHNMRNAEQFT